MNPTFIINLTRIILAADLSTRREFESLSRDDPRLLEIANEWMYRKDSGRMRAAVDDASAIAWAVWRDYMKPHVVNMLVKDWGAGVEDATRVVEKYFKDDSPQYNPERRPPWQK